MSVSPSMLESQVTLMSPNKKKIFGKFRVYYIRNNYNRSIL